MTAMEYAIKSMERSFEVLKMHLAEFSDADMMVRPVPGANHAAWQVGHLLAFEIWAANLLGAAGAPEMSQEQRKFYGKQGASSDDASKFPKKDELLRMMSQSHAALVKWARALKPEDLDKDGPAPFKGFIDHLGDVVSGIDGHITMHIGQIQVIRRKLGKKIMF